MRYVVQVKGVFGWATLGIHPNREAADKDRENRVKHGGLSLDFRVKEVA